MTMPTGLLEWGQAGQFNAIDDRSALAALYVAAGGLGGLVVPPTFTAGTGLAVTMGPWSAIADCGDGTKAVIGSRASATFNETAGGASARADVVWADINPDNATWTVSLITEAAMTGRSGVFLGLILVPASASTSAAMDLRPGNSRIIGPWGRAQFPSQSYGGTGWGTLASMVIPAYDSDVGAVYEIEAWGNGSVTQAGKTTLSMRANFGSTPMNTITQGSTAFGTTNAFRWWAAVRLIVVAVGTSGVVRSMINFGQNETANVSPGNGNFVWITGSESSGSYAKDSTRDATFSLQASWGGSGQSITCQTMIAKRIA
jgi:hypothetical protein